MDQLASEASHNIFLFWCRRFLTSPLLSLWLWKIFIYSFVFLNIWAFLGQKDSLTIYYYDSLHFLMLFILSNLMGELFKLVRLPVLLGYLVAGFAYGNILDVRINKSMVSITRSLALMIILLRAGLNLDPEAIKKLSFVCFCLAFVPCLIEALTVGIGAWFLFNLPFMWSLMLGFVLAAVSPAIVVPGMIKLQESGLGVQKGIPTLIIAAASVDDVLAITGFSICLSFVFSSNSLNESIWEKIHFYSKGLFEAFIGLLYGLSVGVLLWFLPEKSLNLNRESSFENNVHETESSYHLHRLASLLLVSLFVLFGSQVFYLDGAGPLAILITSFVASIRWRQHRFNEIVDFSLKILWEIFQHYLFCLIGFNVRFKTMLFKTLVAGILTLLFGLITRTLAAYLVTYGSSAQLTRKERFFTAIAWLPKATVQAAIGSVALDMARKPEDIEHGQIVLIVAALSILITAPIGTIAIDLFAKPLLQTTIYPNNKTKSNIINQENQSKNCDQEEEQVELKLIPTN